MSRLHLCACALIALDIVLMGALFAAAVALPTPSSIAAVVLGCVVAGLLGSGLRRARKARLL